MIGFVLGLLVGVIGTALLGLFALGVFDDWDEPE